MASKYLERKRIHVKMQNIENYPLSIIHAPMGYGKSVAVKEYVDQSEAQCVWVPLASSEGEKDYLWSRLCEGLEALDSKLASQFASIGFPYDCFKTEALLDLLMDYDYKKEMILVFDDFHIMKDNGVFDWLRTLVRERINHLHIVIITRELAKIDAADLYQKQLCFTITEKSLKFNQEEVFRYIDFMDCQLTQEEKEKVYKITEGWGSMLYITLKGIQQGLPIEKSATADDIIEQNFYNQLSEIEKRVLAKLSALPSFTKRMAAYVLDDSLQYESFEQMTHKSLIFIFQEIDHTYKLRNILRDYIYERAVIERIDFIHVYLKSGEWMLREGQESNGFEYLYKAGAYEALLTMLNKKTGETTGLWGNPNLYALFENAGTELCYKYPIAYLKYLLNYAMDRRHNGILYVKKVLGQFEKYVTEFMQEVENYEIILGEICMVKSRLAFNDLHEMARYSKMGAACFGGGCSAIVTKQTEFTFGLPHMTMAYLNKEKDAEQVKEFFIDKGIYFTEATDGCGIGCDSLALAEIYLETGVFDQVELYAYKAYYKARSAGQLSIMISAKFVLDRYHILYGSKEEKLVENHTLKEEVLRDNNAVLNSTFDLCNAFVHTCLGKVEAVPEWIRNGEIEKGTFLRPGTSYFYIVYGKCLLLMKKYIELDSLCESFSSFLKPYQYQLVTLYFMIYESVAKSYLENRQKGEDILYKAIEYAREDGYVMPFAENSQQIKVMLEAIHTSNKEDKFIHRVYECCEEYRSKFKIWQNSKITLTEREVEMLRLLDEGYTHEEIASEVYISVATVRYHIKNIYNKMDVNNKILALRKAKDLNLI